MNEDVALTGVKRVLTETFVCSVRKKKNNNKQTLSRVKKRNSDLSRGTTRNVLATRRVTQSQAENTHTWIRLSL